jgi:hypothetical protein
VLRFLLLFFLLPLMTVTGLDPSRARGLLVEAETTVSAHAAVACSHASKRGLGRPGEGTLFRREARQELDEFIHGM